MCTLFESPVNPMVAVLYKECKEECKFTDKSDSDFLLFLLNSAVRILNVVKDFSPLLEVTTGMSSPLDSTETFLDKTNQSGADISSCEPGTVDTRISEYEDVLLDKIEKSSDMETLQKYIDKVQRSLEELPPLNESSSANQDGENQSDEADDQDIEGDSSRTKTPSDANESEGTDVNGTMNSEDILTDAISEISEILNKANFDEDLRKLTGINPLSRSDGNNFSCTICFTHFKNQRNLSRHIRLGVCLEKNFNCKLCDHSFATEYGLKRHLSRTMCKKRAIEENTSLSPNKAAKLEEDSIIQAQFICDLCNYSFATKAALTQHASSTKCDNNRLQGLASKESKPPGFFQCPHCKSTLASKAGLAKHLKRAQCRVYQCPYCTKSFRYLHEVRTHRRLEHKDSDELNTSVARNFFNNMGGVPTMTYATNILNNISALPYLRGSQLDMAAHQCKVCSYAGTCKRSLENHMRMHVRQLKAIGDNEKCTQCDFTSDDQNDLLKHYINKHPGLPYFKMAPKGTFIVRSNRMTEPKVEGSAEIKAEHTTESPEGGAEEDNTGTSDESESIDDSKVEVALPLNDNESEEIDCVSLNSQCIRESLEGDTEIPCDIV
ncbi:zinc finger protein 423-like isoform X2 [Bolinopsis microptera]|uniref:zinc finger protein 423-like isoform X2 n=1 Tax=Bolinopsis microptera TaxID=2820187 RepID=UPI0030791B65